MGAIRREKTKRRTRDVDQVHGDLRSPRQLEQLKALVPDEDKPGLGQFYCIECAKYFESLTNMEAHTTGKKHKRRVRMLKAEPYTIDEANAAAGLGVAAFLDKKRKAREAEEFGQKAMEVDEDR